MFGRASKVISPAPARQQLCDAMLARDAAKADLEKTRAVVARVQAVIDSADDADGRAEDARVVAADAAKRWAAAGADPEATAERERLAAAAKEARSAADEALDLAQGARLGLPKVQDTELDAQNALMRAEEQIGELIGIVLLEEKIRPHLELLEKSAKQYRSACREVEAALGVFNSRSPFARTLMPHACSEVTAAIVPILEQAKKDVIHVEGYVEAREDLDPRRKHYEQLARALRVDPNAS